MRRITNSIACCLFVLLPAVAPLSPVRASSADAFDYATATKLLVAGKDFEQAITLLQSAVKADPKNSDYHLALGCAYADRAASIGHADDWQYHENGTKQPPASFHPYTKDDGKPFGLTDAQAKAEVASLGGLARKEWQIAVALSHSKKDRAYAEYVEGWGLWVFDVFTLEANPPTDSPPPVHAEMLQAFHAATRDDPSNSAYWESLAYNASGFLSIDYTDYRRALRLKPHNPGVWYTLFEAYLTKSEQVDLATPAARQAAAKQAVQALQNCIGQALKNAYPLYSLAYVKLDLTAYTNSEVNTPYITRPAQADAANKAMVVSLTPKDREAAREALALMDKAATLPECSLPTVEPQVPALLSAPWRYAAFDRSPDVAGDARLRALARGLFGVVMAHAMEHDMPGAALAAHAIIAIGNQVTGGWPDRDTSGGYQTIYALTGIEVANIGYDTLCRVEERYGTPTAAKKAKAEYAAYKARRTAYLNRMGKSESLSGIYAQY